MTGEWSASDSMRLWARSVVDEPNEYAIRLEMDDDEEYGERLKRRRSNREDS